MSNHQNEVAQGERFEFGKNWSQFLELLNDERIEMAEASLKKMLEVEDLKGKNFLDAGSGSGLFSLAARRLGARVHSFDYDPNSVACTTELKKRYFTDDPEWIVESGSVLDKNYLEKLGQFDIVYSWGVLHHTGAMWLGIENAINKVEDEGYLFVAIYNDQGIKSHIWYIIKYIYNQLPSPLNTIYAYAIGLTANILNIIKYTLKLKPMIAIRPLIQYKKKRGMSAIHDMIDWIGGFPYEFATYEVLTSYLESRGFTLVNGNKATSLGCHEMVFIKSSY